MRGGQHPRCDVGIEGARSVAPAVLIPIKIAPPMSQRTVHIECRGCGQHVKRRVRRGLWLTCPLCGTLNPGPASIGLEGPKPRPRIPNSASPKKPKAEADAPPKPESVPPRHPGLIW